MLTEAPYRRPGSPPHAPPLLREPTGPRELSHPNTGRITRDLSEAEGSPSVIGAFTQQHAACWWHRPRERTRQPGVKCQGVAGGAGECSPTPQLVQEVRPCRVGPPGEEGRHILRLGKVGAGRGAQGMALRGGGLSSVPFSISLFQVAVLGFWDFDVAS